MTNLSLVIDIGQSGTTLSDCLAALSQHARTLRDVEIVIVGNDPAGMQFDDISASLRNRLDGLHYVGSTKEGLASAWNAGLQAATQDWIMFSDMPSDIPENFILCFCNHLQTGADSDVALFCSAPDGRGRQRSSQANALIQHAPGILDIRDIGFLPGSDDACIFNRKKLISSGLQFDGMVRPGFEHAALAACYLLTQGEGRIGILPQTSYRATSQAHFTTPPISMWRNKASYGTALVRSYLLPLQAAMQKLGHVPSWLQQAVADDLQKYFVMDSRERSPTVVVSEAMADEFHLHVSEIMRHVDSSAIFAQADDLSRQEAAHALLAYKQLNWHSPVFIDAYDREQGFLRLSYYIHGAPPSESIVIDGQNVEPAFQKYRGCRFFRRLLFRQRIAWTSVDDATSIQVLLNDLPAKLALGGYVSSLPHEANHELDTELSLHEARLTLTRNRRPKKALPSGLAGLKVRLVKWLATQSLIKRMYANAWVFLDRWEEADDNAEHLYRWVKQHHPDINAWFLLERSSEDWNRLSDEGFRLMPKGLRRKLLLLNSKHIISSHAECTNGGFDPSHYGDMMNWRSTFIPHGISKDDVSHWLNGLPFDLIASTSPAECASFIDDDTPYKYTAKEIRLTGFPRQDKLLEALNKTPQHDVNILLIMPTWRAELVDGRRVFSSEEDRNSAIRDSDYVQHWSSLLNSEELLELVERYGKKIVFYPHTNSLPYLDAFNVPGHVTVLSKKNCSILPLLCRATALITDFTSVAFEIANLRRPTFYYQFDREEFYGGGHNWRQGYFDYDENGFGPVAIDQMALISHLREFFMNNDKIAPEYLARMEYALPLFDGKACKRVFSEIDRLDTSYRRLASL